MDRISLTEKFAGLPVVEVAEEILESLARHPRLIVTAPPGAGKSTLLPLLILDSIPQGKILMLEPRRIAARQVASRMAEMLGEPVGATVGYRVRFDSRVSSATRIEVITEGILERILIDDPTLEGVAAIFFDEYHERSISSDLSLALTREIQSLLRPDLKILLMSATIDARSLSEIIDAPHIHSEGKCYDVKIIYSDDIDPADCAVEAARKVMKALHTQQGNILVFLPGEGEIGKCIDLLNANLEIGNREKDPSEEYLSHPEILPLYGRLSPNEQQRVMKSPEKKEKRRIIVATPVAETSLTIEGISIVIDSGLYRKPVFDPSTGLTRLVTTRISMDMARQRTGRAGRLMPGVCYRLWSKAVESRMKDMRQPEILSADLSPLVLTTTQWGEPDPRRLPWVTPPPDGHLSEGQKLLRLLGAIDEAGRLTQKGRRMDSLPCHPRLAAMLTETPSLSSTACDIAALLEEKDPIFDDKDADITTRLSLLRSYRRNGRNLKSGAIWRRIDEISRRYSRLLGENSLVYDANPEEIGVLVATAYPERIAMRDATGQYRTIAGELLTLSPADNLERNEFLGVASIGAGKRISLASPLDREYVVKRGEWYNSAVWNAREGRAIVRDELRLGSLILATRQAKGNLREIIAEVIAAAAPKEGLTMFVFSEDVRDLQQRIAVATDWHPEFGLPDVTTEEILARAAEWLPLYIGSATNVTELRKIDMCAVILGLLSYEQQQWLDRVAPTHLRLPAGRTVRIRYRRGAEAPVASARLQDCFGLLETPLVDENRRPVLMELLSPGFKPVQLTQDMPGFWRSTYFEIRKELRRRYPKHKWPDDPNG